MRFAKAKDSNKPQIYNFICFFCVIYLFFLFLSLF